MSPAPSQMEKRDQSLGSPSVTSVQHESSDMTSLALDSSYFSPKPLSTQMPWVVGAALAHAAIVAFAFLFYQTPPQAPEIFSVSLLPMSPPAPTLPAPAPKPQPVIKQAQPKPTVVPKPAPSTSQTAISQAQPTPTQASADAPSTVAPSGADKPSTTTAAIVPAHDAAYLNNPRPAYPAMSRRLGEEGRVMLEVHVLADGTPSKVSLAKSSGFSRLDDAAVEAVKRWKFVPAKRGGEAVAAVVTIPMPFVLEK